MAKRPEKVRLLLVTNENNQKSKHRHKDCFLFTLAKVVFLTVLILFLIFIATRVVQIQNSIKSKGKESEEGMIPGSDFCKSVNADNMSLVALGYLKGVKESVKTMEASDKIYYISDRLFTDQEACAVEALLRLLQEKSVFVIEIGNFTSGDKIDYIQFLREHYTNLNQIRSTPSMFFKGSPFQNYLNEINDFSIFAAKVLLVWQFGGTVLSPNFMLLTRRIFGSNEGFCEVDRELLFCPNQCSAFVYQLIKTILDILKSTKNLKQLNEQSLEDIVNESVAAYCGDKAMVSVGCIGINRIKPHTVCHEIEKNCDFLRVQQWKLNDGKWKTVVHKFCPKIVMGYMPQQLKIADGV